METVQWCQNWAARELQSKFRVAVPLQVTTGGLPTWTPCAYVGVSYEKHRSRSVEYEIVTWSSYALVAMRDALFNVAREGWKYPITGFNELMQNEVVHGHFLRYGAIAHFDAAVERSLDTHAAAFAIVRLLRQDRVLVEYGSNHFRVDPKALEDWINPRIIGLVDDGHA